MRTKPLAILVSVRVSQNSCRGLSKPSQNFKNIAPVPRRYRSGSWRITCKAASRMNASLSAGTTSLLQDGLNFPPILGGFRRVRTPVRGSSHSPVRVRRTIVVEVEAWIVAVYPGE